MADRVRVTSDLICLTRRPDVDRRRVSPPTRVSRTFPEGVECGTVTTLTMHATKAATNCPHKRRQCQLHAGPCHDVVAAQHAELALSTILPGQ
jgi:hypothetical protein